jgi:hypothetical protein
LPNPMVERDLHALQRVTERPESEEDPMRMIAVGALCAGLAACGPPPVETAATPGTRGVMVTAAEVPAGTELVVALVTPVSGEAKRAGDRVVAEVVRPLVTAGGEMVVPMGASLHGTVTAVAPRTVHGQQTAIAVHFDELVLNGEAVRVAAEVVQVDLNVEDSERVMRRKSVGSEGYVALGGILGADLATTHTGVDFAPAWSVISLGMGDIDPVLPAGTRLTVRTTERASLR